jgi:hypothetical protein
MEHHPEFEMDSILLECRRYAEATIVLGCEKDWRLASRSTVECECGESLTVSSGNRSREEEHVEQLLRRCLSVVSGR